MTSATQGQLSDSVAVLRGVGPKRVESLRLGGIESIRDLVLHFPTRHEMYPASRPIGVLTSGDLATVVGEIIRCRVSRSRRRGTGHLHVRIKDQSGEIDATFFNQAYLKSRVAKGEWCQITGVVTDDSGGVRLAPKYVEVLTDRTSVRAPERWIAIHRSVTGVPQGTLQSVIDQALDIFAERPDPLPPDLCRTRGLLQLSAAVRGVHQPQDAESLALAEDRLLYNSLLSHSIIAACSGRRMAASDERPSVQISPALEKQISGIFPFEFTPGQQSAVEVIAQEFQQRDGLRRLLIGDVGCGKTVVGIWAMAAVLANGHQVAVLAPTTTLANQWYHELSRHRPFGEDPVLLIGGMSSRERAHVLERVLSGAARVVVGTHSILQDDVIFESLGLMVVDEQHRFGVLQRLALTRQGHTPHVLAMSATPIPRSLALCLYGDSDPIEIRDRPPGHGKVRTHLYRRTHGSPFDWGAAAQRAMQGVQMFVVFPSIESDDGALPSLIQHGRRLVDRFFSDVAVGFLHGSLPATERASVLSQFRNGEIQVLLTTTVIEVGVDIRNAGEIILVGAERFGLAQLHQLRGRVGRGREEGHCHLIVSNSAPDGESRRLTTLIESNSGFEIAAMDLELRGPGDIMGLRQHGPALLPIASISEDRLADAVEDARRLASDRTDVLELATELGTWSRRGHVRGDDLAGAI